MFSPWAARAPLYRSSDTIVRADERRAVAPLVIQAVGGVNQRWPHGRQRVAALLQQRRKSSLFPIFLHIAGGLVRQAGQYGV
jgi:hypothetical protein